ncbi:enoyl-CoA hydratase-related protein [Sporomusa termitida]|uniref:Crotonyl-CoA hydratase n=1 Tax=Sporomusa termitida TaxID=2377 RepID=A0A517DQ66_9FIRM|nr:enoyl-CoA hydratase-related protein [Sporomusa termitida]QDR79499.1 Crotonyl-CoA hydratase [Sporomusa termitida]
MGSYQNILVEKEDNGICTVTINRPKVLNALNPETMRELDDAADKIAADLSIRVVIITGSGNKAFVAGADIASMSTMGLWEGREWGVLGGGVSQKIEELPQIVIAAVNGYALGGGTVLATSCNIRLAADNAVFGLPEVKLGIMAGFACTQTLPRLIGVPNAIELMTTGKHINAQEAYRIGLVNKVVPANELLAAAREMAKQIAANGPLAVRLTKRAIYEGLSMDLAAGRIYERELHGLCFTTEDQKEGMRAFLEKRKPNFKDR